MRVAFRVDGSDRIGTGHIVRCLTLAEQLRREGHDCQFIVRNHAGAPTALIAAKGFACALLPQPDGKGYDELSHAAWLGTSQTRDAEETIAAIDGPIDWLVVDHYAIDHRWHLLLRASVKKIFVIDDIADRVHDCDLLLDQNLQSDPGRYDGLTPPACRRMLGPRYALLKPRFAELRSQAGTRAADGPILIYFGGVDAPGATLVALDAMSRTEFGGRRIDVVVGDLNPNRSAIADWCAARDNTGFHGGGTDMAKLMSGASLAIGAGGATAWERCCLGLPTILVSIAENQKPGAAALAREGAVIWLGDLDDVSAPSLSAAILTMHTAQGLADVVARHAASLVDGLGSNRVVRAMASAPIAIRVATMEDCAEVWEWRNDLKTRRYFNDPKPVPIDVHQGWFEASLVNPRRALLIGERAGEPVGVLRYDRRDDTAHVSVYLVPGREGKGDGPELLAAGSDWLTHHWPDVALIEAEVLEANRASSSAFLSAGFTLHRLNYQRALKIKDMAR